MLRFLFASVAVCLGTVQSSSVWTSPVELNIDTTSPHKHQEDNHVSKHGEHDAKDLFSQMKSLKENTSSGELPTCPTSRYVVLINEFKYNKSSHKNIMTAHSFFFGVVGLLKATLFLI